MPQIQRMYCSKCGISIGLVEVRGKRVPLVAYMVLGQGPDTGRPVAWADPEMAIPSFARELGLSQIHGGPSRIELCMNCLADFMNVPLVTPSEDPMFDQNMDQIADADQIKDEGMDQVEREQLRLFRVFFAVDLAHGKVTKEALPEGQKAPEPVVVGTRDILSTE